MPDAEGQPRRKRQRADSQSPHADDGAHDRDPDPGHGRGSADEVSACQSCRRRKLRCSKQQPCQQCERLHVNCTYHHERRRPGFKPGAIEALSQRVANLEQMFLGQALMFQHRLGLGREGSHVTGISDGRQADLHSSIADIRETYLNAATEACSRPNLVERSGPAQDDAQSHMQNLELCRENGVNHDTDELLPSESILRGLVAWYFENVHRWIPVLHQRRFWEMFNNPEERPRMHIILLSMTSCCLQFERPSDMSLERSKTIITRCRHAVILKSMEHFSVESLQALVILAFNLIGSGQGPRSWGIIGSMVRTAEQLRLDMEPVEEGTSERDQDGYMIRRMTFLPLARTWIEEEERRRVFWCVFMLDRFCSVATGWGNGLVGAGSRRRLPCEGLLWERGTPVDTPFFQAETETHAPTPRSGEESPENDSISNIGGLAFCLEATDTLNLVTKFLLQRAVQFTGSQQVRLWLLKFKELDLRLVKWRLSLPEKWREASVLNQDGIMDPNLTLAHITQNTAVIQLHQCIAFPPASLQACHVALPSASSAETCVSAACEIGTIAQEFLQQSSGIVHPQLAFCLFIAGRVLLVNASHFGTGVLPAFSNICTVLHEVGRRWDHDGTDEPQLLETRNLAFRLSSRLLNAHSAMDPSLLTPNKVTTLDVGRPVCSEYCPRSRAVSEGPTIDAEITQEDHQPAMVGVEGFRAPTMSGEQHRPLLVPTIGEDETQLFTNFNCEQPFWDLIQAASGSVAEKGDTNNEWMNGLDGVFDENFQQMLRVSNYADTGNQSGNSNWFPS